MNEGKDKDNGRSIEEAECVGLLNSSAIGEETTLRSRQSKKRCQGSDPIYFDDNRVLKGKTEKTCGKLSWGNVTWLYALRCRDTASGHPPDPLHISKEMKPGVMSDTGCTTRG